MPDKIWSVHDREYRARITNWLEKNPFYSTAEFGESDMSVIWNDLSLPLPKVIITSFITRGNNSSFIFSLCILFNLYCLFVLSIKKNSGNDMNIQAYPYNFPIWP